jgi:hypothetical protein
MIDIVRKEIDSSHYYFVEGQYFPGVTSVLDQACPKGEQLLNWMKSNSQEEIERISEESMAFGSKLHDAYERLLNGEELNLADDYKNTKAKRHLVSFYNWFQSTKPTMLETEQTVASLTYKYAGTLDLACQINGELWIIDFKTGSGIYFSHELQLAAYKQAYEEMHGVKVKHVGILRTGSKHKSGYEFKEIVRPFDEFLNVYNLYLALHDGKIPQPPLVNAYPDTIKLELEAETCSVA